MRPVASRGTAEMNTLSRAALGCGASILALSLAGGLQAAAEPAYPAVHQFDIKSQPLLAALADFTATTGVQVVRPGARRIVGQAPAVTGRQDADAALTKLLSNSGLTFRATGPRTVTLENADIQTVQLAGEATFLEQIDVVGRKGGGERRSEGGDGKIDVTAKDLARKQPQDIKQVFRGEPGIQVGGSTPASHKVYVHGVEESNLAVSIDGAAQNNKVFHHNGNTLIDPALLRAVRVDAGVAPADAGFGALAGSIAYETKDVGDLLDEQAEVPPLVSKDPVAPAEPKWWGGFSKTWWNSNGNVWGENAAIYAKKNGFEGLAFFNIARGDNYKNGSGAKVGGTETHMTSGLVKFAYEADSGHRFEVNHERVDDNAIRPFRANAQVVKAKPGEPLFRNYHLQRQNSSFTYTDTSPTAMWDPKVVVGYSATQVQVPIFLDLNRDGIYTNDYDAEGRTTSLTGRAENKFSFDIGSLTTGFDFRHDTAKLDDVYDAAGEKMTQVGAYAQARLEPIKNARLSFGGRADYQDFKGVENAIGRHKKHGGVSGNVSGEYDLIPEHLTAKAGYSHVWAGVPLAENFIMNPAWLYEGQRGELKATTADNVNVGMVAKYKGFTVEGSVFRTAIDNARIAKYAWIYRPFDKPGVFGRLGGSYTRNLLTKGFELGAGYAWETGFVKVKWASIKSNINGKRADSDAGIYLTTPVGDIITVTAAHTFAPWNVTVGADAEFAPKYKRVAGFYKDDDRTKKFIKKPYPYYNVVNAFAEYKPQFMPFETTFRVDVKNILNKTFSSRANYGNEFGNVTPLFEPGRSVIVSAAVKF